jgi:hypothetical protein
MSRPARAAPRIQAIEDRGKGLEQGGVFAAPSSTRRKNSWHFQPPSQLIHVMARAKQTAT